MSTHPLRVWLTYAAIVIVLTIGFGWLSLRVVELDRQERLARLRAEQEERISLALWRMDSVAMPIVAAEAARPYFVYQQWRPEPTKGGPVTPPTLLSPQSEYVVLNFQFNNDGTVVSPQVPPVEAWPFANTAGISNETLNTNGLNNTRLQQSLNLKDLLTLLPEQTTPSNFLSLNQPSVDREAQPPTDENGDQQQLDESQQLQVPQQLENSYVVNDLPNQSASQQKVPRGGRSATPPNDYANRSGRLQQFAQQAAIQQRANIDTSLLSESVSEGVSRPLWMDGKLLLARRVVEQGESVVQGCWLNWDCLEEDLLNEVDDLLPTVTLAPISPKEMSPPARTLASIPVSLVVSDVTVPNWEWTSTTISLSVAWGGLLAAIAAVAYLLFGVTSLSERRAAFVSAVTHELRTPLTTFQLYTEMLTGGMVSDEAKKSEYIATLHREASRLGHLIDNVLAYARLERRGKSVELPTITIASLLERLLPRMTEQAQLAGLTLITPDPKALPDCHVRVEPTVIEQILMNLIDNACKYANSSEDACRVELTCTTSGNSVHLTLRDQGPGIATDVRRRLFTPFSKSDQEAARTAPGVGLGLALSRGLARQQGGDLELVDTSANGTVFRLSLPISV